MAKSPRDPWSRPNPRKPAGKATKHLTAAQKSEAKSRAARAGRRYPNLVDNMAVAKQGTSTKTRGGKRAAAKQPAKSSGSRSAPKRTSAGKTRTSTVAHKRATRKARPAKGRAPARP